MQNIPHTHSLIYALCVCVFFGVCANFSVSKSVLLFLFPLIFAFRKNERVFLLLVLVVIVNRMRFVGCHSMLCLILNQIYLCCYAHTLPQWIACSLAHELHLPPNTVCDVACLWYNFFFLIAVLLFCFILHHCSA